MPTDKVQAIIDARDREWSNRLMSQDLVRPDSPDLDLAIAWYASQKRLTLGKSPVAADSDHSRCSHEKGERLTRQENR